MSGNKATEAASVVYHKDSVIVEKEAIAEAGEIAAADRSLNSNNGFTVYAAVNTTATRKPEWSVRTESNSRRKSILHTEWCDSSFRQVNQ